MAKQDSEAERRERIAQLGRDQAARAGVSYQEVGQTPAEERPTAPEPEEVESLADVTDASAKEGTP